MAPFLLPRSRWGVGLRLVAATAVVLLVAGCTPTSKQADELPAGLSDSPTVQPEDGGSPAAPESPMVTPEPSVSPSAMPPPAPPSPSPTSQPEPVEPTPDPPAADGGEDTAGPDRADVPAADSGDSADQDAAVEEPRSTDPAPAEGGQPEEPQGDTQPAADGSVVLGRGDSGPQVAAVQQQLAELGYWVGPTVDGEFGSLTEQAVLAFQGWEGLSRDGRVGPNTRAALADAVRPQPVGDGDLLEVHLDQQVLLVVEDGRTEWVLHTSTGSGKRYVGPSGREAVADTPVGEFEISWRVNGWRESDLGRLWRPVYFHSRGIAVHGYPSVPSYPASHGCVRVPMAAMDLLWEEQRVDVGTPVAVIADGD